MRRRRMMMGRQRLYTKTLHLAGTGSDQTNYILPIRVHHGSKRGDSAQPGDIYLDSHGLTDFSDVKFYDANGNLLSAYKAGYGNYELIPDARFGKQNWIHSDGSILAGHTPGAPTGIQRSIDDGISWTTLYNTGLDDVILIDSRGYAYIFNNNDHKLYQSTNWTEVSPTFTAVLDLSSYTGQILPPGISEDTAGNMFIGRYQAAKNPGIYKSTAAQHGGTWTEVMGYTTSTVRPRNTAVTYGQIVRPATANSHLYYCSVAGTTQDAADDGTHPTWPTGSGSTVTDGGVTWKECSFQHIHGLKVDLLTDYIYAGVDGDYPKLIRSSDHGSTWYVIWDNQGADVTQMYFEAGKRFFGAGASGYDATNAVLQTTDDLTFTISLQAHNSIQALFKIGTTLYACAVCYGIVANTVIYRSTDDGATWKTAWYGVQDPNESLIGYNSYLNSGTPTGDELHAIIGPSNGTVTYIPLHVYDGGNHYQAQFYVKIPSLPNAGTTITVKCKGTGISDKTIFTNRVETPAPLCRWKLDEGTGTTINDSGSANKPGVLTAGSGAWVATNGRFSTPYYPHIVQAGASYKFNDDSITITNSANDATFNLITNYSIVCWVAFFAGWDGGPVIHKGYPSGTGYWCLDFSSGGTFKVIFKGAGGVTSTYEKQVIDLQWHQIGYTVDNAGKFSPICDGVKYASVTPTNGIATNDTSMPVMIGKSSDGSEHLQKIGLDDIQIYGTELTTLQVQQLYEDRPLGTSEVVIS
jgi:hypothetical protein